MMASDWALAKFCIEDTVDKCYRDVSASLLRRGWKRIAYRKKTKLEKKKYLNFRAIFCLRLVTCDHFVLIDFPLRIFL